MLTAMKQIDLFDDTPFSVGEKPLPTEDPGYQPDWKVEQDNTPLENDRIIWTDPQRGEEVKATVVKVYKRGDKVKILTNTWAYLTVPISQITVLTTTIAHSVGNESAANSLPTENTVGNDFLFPTQNTVGNESAAQLLPTQNTVGNEEAAQFFPTDFYKAAPHWDLSTLHNILYFLEREISHRGEAVTILTDGNIPQPYIEAKKLPYTNKKRLKKYRGPYYYLRDGKSKKSQYLCSKRENIPEQYRELPIYGEDIPF